MPSEVLFSNTLVMLERLLDLHSLRHDLISANIANVDTPGYKGHDLQFQEELKRAIGDRDTLPLWKTQQQHLPKAGGNLAEIEGRVVTSGVTHRRDGNSVDLDREMAKLAENSLYYNTAVQLLSKKLGTVKSAIVEVR